MHNFLIKIIIILTIFYSGDLFAMWGADKEDIELSKKNFLISGNHYDEKDKSQGAVTLCFKTLKDNVGPIEYTYEHAALVFEVFLPALPNDVSVRMIHYGGDSDCCCGKNKHPIINGPEETLKHVYRAKKTNEATGEVTYLPPTYTKYASWILPNKNLIKGYTLADTDSNEHSQNPKLCDSYSCISYVQRIMREVGLAKVDFGWWPVRADNLKELVDKHILPQPHSTQYKEIELPNIQ